jgi:hypothetical protein
MKGNNPNSKILFNKKEIKQKLKKDGKFNSINSTIIQWIDELNEDTEMYVINTKKNGISFMGVVDFEFKREGYGLNQYPNNGFNEEYFGYYKNDERNGQGLYIYKPKLLPNRKVMREYYFGLWENNFQNGRGIYLWLEDDNNTSRNRNISINPFKNFESANFCAYVGQFDKDNFKKGTLLKKNGDKYYVFHGTFEANKRTLKKNGSNNFYYNSDKEELMYGTFLNDRFVDGYLGKFNLEGEMTDIAKYPKIQTKIKDNNVKIAEKKMFNFRNIIMKKDYFGDLYNTFKNVIDFKNQNMNDINIFNSDDYINIMDIMASYNTCSIFKDIERNIDK